MKKQLCKWALVFGGAGIALAAPLSDPAACAAEHAVLEGKIVDALGHPIPQARVRLFGANRHRVATATSDAEGAFRIAGLVPGAYTVFAEKAGFQPATSVVTVGPATSVRLTLGALEALSLEWAAERLNRARNELSPETGSSIYRIDREAIEHMPRGETTPVNQVLLQAPGVVQDSFGQLFVRGDHSNLQYRFNGVLIPEGINVFGQLLDARFIEEADLLTGALPAQFGYRTAGVVNLRTKSGLRHPGASLGLNVGSYGTFEPSLQLGGGEGGSEYYVSGTYTQHNLGLSPPTADPSPIHNQTRQGRAFGHASSLLTPTIRGSALWGSAVQSFQVPAVPGLEPAYRLEGVSNFRSADIKSVLRPDNHFGIVALQGVLGDALDYQLAGFGRYSASHYIPDPVGDLIFDGVAADVFRSNMAYGLQADLGYKLDEAHTLRFGAFSHSDRTLSNAALRVFPVDAGGAQTSDRPLTITDFNTLSASFVGMYLQDEWRPLEALTLNYGARYDWSLGQVTESQLSPRLGLVYVLSPRTRLHAGYARYFTPPPTELVSLTTLERFQGTTNEAAIDVNTAVLPERSHYLDVGIRHQLTSELSLGWDNYLREVSNLIDQGQFGRALIFSSFNYEHARILGSELSASFRQGPFSGYVNGAYSRAVGRNVTSGQFNFAPEELAYIAENDVFLDHNQALTASAGLTYDWWGTRFNAAALFGSGLASGFLNRESLPPYWQLDAGASRRLEVPVLGALETRLAVVNLLDNVYLLRDGTGIGVGAPQFAPRRGLYLIASRSF